MILPEHLKKHPTMTTQLLAALAKRQFDGHLFLGISNGGQFVYRAHKNLGDKIVFTKVFVTPAGVATVET